MVPSPSWPSIFMPQHNTLPFVCAGGACFRSDSLHISCSCVVYLRCLRRMRISVAESMAAILPTTFSVLPQRPSSSIIFPAPPRNIRRCTYEPTGNYATGARSFASSSAVVLCTTSRGKFHMTGIVPAAKWFGASFSALSFCCASKALVPRGEW